MPAEPEAWPVAVDALAERLYRFGWISDLFVGGSLATGDYRPGVSDIDLVAVADAAATPEHVAALAALHGEIDHGSAAHTDLGCAYVDESRLADHDLEHPTWTHGRFVKRPLSPSPEPSSRDTARSCSGGPSTTCSHQ